MDWENLQRPGFSPDYTDQRYARMDLAFARSDWIATPAAQALIRNSRSLLGYVGGKPGHFTSKDHNFLPGETVEKQLIVLNNSRQPVTCDSQWSLELPQPITGSKQIAIATGQQERVPLRFELPAVLPPARYELRATFQFRNGETQQDSFWIDVLPSPKAPPSGAKIALFDPKGETRALLSRMGVPAQPVEAGADLTPYHILIVGKAALTAGGAAPDTSRVREGLKVILFEQSSEVLEKRFGFRVEEYGLRHVFPRVLDHPVLAGLATVHLGDWHGEATLLSPRLKYEMRPRNGPTVQWCDIPVTRVWRCGNRGNVASVLIEKPARGDFLPILDGGYSLQYSPLLEYREGQGLMLFCQMDVTGRTESEPAAEALARNLLAYVSGWKPAPRRTAVYVGDAAGRQHLEAIGVPLSPSGISKLSPGQILIVGPGGVAEVGSQAQTVAEWRKQGGTLLAIGLGEAEAAALPSRVGMTKREHISAYFEAPGMKSPFAGIGPADVHNRDPRELPLVANGAMIIGDGVLALAGDSQVVFCQIAPWQFGNSQPGNLRRTYRRTAFLLSRVLGNLGVEESTPLLERFHRPPVATGAEKRWLTGLYVDQPEEWDDPYRFFRW